VKKSGSTVFQLNFKDFESTGKADLFFTFYKQLMKNRRLARFCREAFIEKADRKLNGLEEQHILLNSYIKSKGIHYILVAIREKETRPSPVVGEVEVDMAVNQIIQALKKGFQNELQIPTPENTVNTLNTLNTVKNVKTENTKTENTITIPSNKPDIEKLMALL
jgi:hypothetical protein